MPYLLLRWLFLAIAIAITAWLLPGIQVSGGVMGLVIAAAVLGLVNAIIRPIVSFFTCPLIILTLGLFILVINAMMLALTSWLIPGILQVSGFWTALFASLIISIVSGLLTAFLHDESRW
ncbi:MAG: phage holin family protein [Anaerolineae bacterium]|nr:phage holin family protein [Anaerolineae bacterium]